MTDPIHGLPSAPTECCLAVRMRKHCFWIAPLAAIGAYLWLVAQTMSAYFLTTHSGNLFPKGHLLPTEKVPGCQEKLKAEYGFSPTDAERIEQRYYWRQMFLLDPSAIAFNKTGILNNPTCLGARIQAIQEVPFSVNYHILEDPDSAPVLSMRKD